VPASVNAALSAGSQVIAPGDPQLSRVGNQIYAAPRQSLDAAEALAQAEGVRVTRLGNDLEGEARTVADAHAALALSQQAKMRAGDPPLVMLSGGELTVTRRGNGIGGPNAEYCLALALALDGAANIWALACDTDGVDGADEVAGAIVHPDTLGRATSASVDPLTSLNSNDAHRFFKAVGGQVVTGPTLTNVNDFRAMLIYPPL